MALGLSLRKISEHSLISEGVENSLVEEKYYEPPLINIIKFACVVIGRFLMLSFKT